MTKEATTEGGTTGKFREGSRQNIRRRSNGAAGHKKVADVVRKKMDLELSCWSRSKCSCFFKYRIVYYLCSWRVSATVRVRSAENFDGALTSSVGRVGLFFDGDVERMQNLRSTTTQNLWVSTKRGVLSALAAVAASTVDLKSLSLIERSEKNVVFGWRISISSLSL